MPRQALMPAAGHDRCAPSYRFGDLLRRHRLRCGFSQAHLAEKAGISVEAVGTLERGTRRAPFSSTITLLIAALDLSKEESAEFETAAAQARARVQANITRHQSKTNNLPAQLSSFVGRENEVAEIQQLVNCRRLVSVTGAGGIGKTRIAVRVAENLLNEFEGTWFVDLTPLTDASFIPTTILSALNAPETPSREPLDTVIAFLKNKHALLIFDNCEHIIEGVASTADAILQRCPRVHIFATSREVLGVAGERVVRVPTLSVPEPAPKALNVEDALKYGAVALFVDRATDADSRFEFTETSVQPIAEICRRLDGIALAIELAAARINILSVTALANNLNERFLILTGGKRTAPSRHRTLRALLDWSYDLLDEREQRILRNLSVFVGGFTLELATMLCAQNEPIEQSEVLDILVSLAGKSLVQYESRYDTTRYRLLESMRQYANEKLRERNESDGAARAHALALLALVERFSPLQFISDHAWKTEAKPEIENWRAALQWAFGPRGDLLIGQRLAGALNDVWFSQTAVEGRRWIHEAINTCDDTTPPSIRAKLEYAQAIMFFPLGRAQSSAALSAAERALHLYEEAGDPLGVAAAQAFIGEALVLKGRIPEGECLLRIALAAAQAGGAGRLVAAVTAYLGIARSIAGDIDTACQLIRKANAIFKAGGSGHQAEIQGMILAEFEFQAGNPEAALQLALESIDVFREYNEALSLCATLCNVAAYAAALEQFDDATGYIHEAIDLALDGGFDLQVAWASQHLASIRVLRSHDNDANRKADLLLAARTLGFVDARFAELERPRDFTEQQEYNKMLRLLRAELGDEFQGLMIEGSRWSTQQTLDELLSPPTHVS